MIEVRLTEAAIGDISELQRHSITEFGDSQTNDYLAGLRAALVRIQNFPGTGISRDDLRLGTRAARYRSHRIYYRTGPNEVIFSGCCITLAKCGGI